jgi:hypothetical protein
MLVYLSGDCYVDGHIIIPHSDTQQDEYIKESSVHMLLSVLRVTVAAAEFILPASASRVVVCGGMYTASLMFYHKEK